MTKIAILVSGRGTNLAAIIEANVPISLVLADRPCRGLDIAAEAGIPTVVINRREFGYQKGAGNNWDRQGFTRAVTDSLTQHGIEVVALAGFMTILQEIIFDRFSHHIINIHPALLPAFKGATAVHDALNAGVKETGSTVHIVTPILDDESYILGQVRVPVRPDDDVETLRDRIQAEEHKLYPRVLKDIAAGTINLEQIVNKE